MSSLNISTTPSEDAGRTRALLAANLIGVFDERDASKRRAAAQDTYTEDVVWYETDRIIRGRAALEARAAELQVEFAGFRFAADGVMSAAQNIGVLRWYYGPEDKPDTFRGTDVIVVEGGKIRALWTTVDDHVAPEE